MKFSKSFLLFGLFSVLFLSACIKDDPEPSGPDTNGDLVITILDEYTTLPAKVSIFFKVSEKDGAPVPFLTGNNFTIYEQGRNDEKERLISQAEAERQISPKGQIFSYSTQLVLDLSGSVVNQNLEDLKKAAKMFVDEVMPAEQDSSFRMGIRWFDGEDELHILAPLTSNKNQLKTAIDGITKEITQDNSTDLYGATIKSVIRAEEIRAAQGNVISAASVVIFTDGTDQAARYAKADAFDAVDNADPSIAFYTIGLGGEIDENVLMQIGKSGSAFAENTVELLERFSEIAQTVSNEANSYYLFEYCSPKRDGSGTNELSIEVEKGNQSGRKSTTFDATGFTGGCTL